MVRKFTVYTTKRKMRRVNGNRVFYTETQTIEINPRIEGKTIHLGYGYKEWYTDHVEGWDSVFPGQKYKLHHSIKPKKGDVWKHGERTFVVGEPEGFLIYTAPLMENGLEVARVKFEDYYMD